MDNLYMVLIPIFIIFFIIILILVFTNIRINNKYKLLLEEYNKLKQISNTSNDNLDNILDTSVRSFLEPTLNITIEEVYMDIKSKNPEIKNKNISISEERKNIILQDVYNRYLDFLSDNFKSRLALIYKEDKVDDLILDKMYYILTNYVSERNEIQKSRED